MSDLDTLISAHLDGELDEEGHRRFEDWLATDPEHQRRFLRQAIEHRALRERMTAQRMQHTPTPPQPRRRGRRPIAFRLVAAAAVAAAMAIAAIGGWRSLSTREPLAPPTPQPAPAFAAAVTSAEDATVGAGTTLGSGDRIATGDHGRAEIRLPDGTRLQLDAAASISLGEDGRLVEVAAGRVAAEVTPQPAGRPLRFRTPEAVITVVGTALSVARADGETLVEVTHGAVSVARDPASAETVPVGAGQRVVMAPSQPLTVAAIGAAFGATYPVGAGQRYATLAALPELAPGDVVEIHPGTYREARALIANGTALRPITIRGIGAEPPLIDGEGIDVSGVGSVPRALLQITGEHVTIEHVAFANARNHANAAAIRLLEARHVVVRDCRIARCDDGLVSADECDDLTIDGCDVGFCGTPEKDGYCHDVYIGGGHALVRGCDLHDALNGQALKSSCRSLEVIANRIRGAEDGEISFIDGLGTAARDSDILLLGNLVVSKADRHGNHQRFIETDSEGGEGRGGTLHLLGNTFVAGDARIVFIATKGGMRVVAEGDIFLGSDHIALPGTAITGRRDWLPPGAEVPPGLLDRVGGDEPGFLDAANGDYRLRAGSSCLGSGVEARYRDASGRERAAAPVGPAPGLGVATHSGPLVVGAFGPAP